MRKRDFVKATILYIARIGIALSVLLNVTLGGHSNQTFSARNWGWHRKGQCNLVWLIDGVCDFILQPLTNAFLRYIICVTYKVDLSNHCMQSWTYWRVRKKHETTEKEIDDG